MLMKQEVNKGDAPIPTASEYREVLKNQSQRFQEVVIDWLVERGVKRHKRQSVEGEKQMLDRLSERCGYLSETELVTLREAWLELAGVCSGVWPSEVTLLHQAHGVRRPPVAYSVKVLSFMQSSEGIDALEKDEAVELLDWLLRNPGVPGNSGNGSFIRGRISAAAEDRRRERARLRHAVESGSARDADIERLRAIEQAQEQARAVVCAGLSGGENAH